MMLNIVLKMMEAYAQFNSNLYI